jgi:hypothetical protein
MKKILVTALFGAFAVAQETTPAKAPSNHSISYSLDLDYKLNGKQYEGEHLVQYTYKFADGYSLQPTVRFFTNYDKVAPNKWHDVEKNDYIQVRWSTPKLWEILGFKTNVHVRYTAPTSKAGAQTQGSYGTLSPRLIMEKEFNSHFNLTLIPKLPIYLQRNGNNVKPGGDPDASIDGDRNPIVGLALEIAPQYKILDNLTVTLDLEIAGVLDGDAGNGNSNTIVEGGFSEELEVMYTFKELGNLGVGWIINDGEGHDFGNHKKAGNHLTDGDSFWTGVRVQKAFNL